MADLYTCPRCDAVGMADDYGPEVCELWVSWTADALFTPDDPPILGDTHVHRWKILCAAGHVFATSDDYHSSEEEQHPPPTPEQMAAAGPIPWRYDRAKFGFVREAISDG